MTGPLVLALDGATYAGSVALIRGADVLAEVTLKDGDGGIPQAGRGERLLPAVAECIQRANVRASEIKRIVCGSGPGRFTSLRVAGAVAKGLATGYGIDLHAVSSLLLTVSAANPALEAGEYLSVLDAMRGDWFVAHISVSADAAIERRGNARLVSAAELAALLSANPNLRAIGPGQSIEGNPHARGVAPLIARIEAEGPVDLASWEPDYGRLPEAQVRREAAIDRPVAR